MCAGRVDGGEESVACWKLSLEVHGYEGRKRTDNDDDDDDYDDWAGVVTRQEMHGMVSVQRP